MLFSLIQRARVIAAGINRARVVADGIDTLRLVDDTEYKQNVIQYLCKGQVKSTQHDLVETYGVANSTLKCDAA